MSSLLRALFGRLPIGWLQLTHSRGRFAAAVAGVAFAALLVFMQLGILGALNSTTTAPYALFRADILMSSDDANSLTDGSNIARARMFQGLAVPGVIDATPLYIGNFELQISNSDTASFQVFGLDVDKLDFLSPEISRQFEALTNENTALIDTSARGISPHVFDGFLHGQAMTFETNGKTLTAVGSFEMGGGFVADGSMFVSDQTFLRFFGQRSSGAPNHILIKSDPNERPELVAERIAASLIDSAIISRTLDQAATDDLAYQTTQRPTGIIFGFGVLIGLIVGVVIVYQVLSTDVADHLREYATFKAMGYGHRFFLGIVFEEALVLAVFGFLPGFLVALGLYQGMSIATGLPIAMTAPRVILVFVGTLAACTVSGAIATRRLAAADPADLF